ncbi:MAG: hypothetical protein IJ746_08425 [Ruminococcus sp.]|nr:hypothetical protein [Ruminococcus sp.]MBR1765401.1 hypothetical protein [Ruminococcus sp.]
MRKALGVICFVLSLAAEGGAGYVTYLTYKQRISYEYGMLGFIPVFIVSYWFGTFFTQLLSPKEGGLLIDRRAYKALSWVQTLGSVALIGFWAYLIYSRSLYLQF